MERLHCILGEVTVCPHRLQADQADLVDWALAGRLFLRFHSRVFLSLEAYPAAAWVHLYRAFYSHEACYCHRAMGCHLEVGLLRLHRLLRHRWVAGRFQR